MEKDKKQEVALFRYMVIAPLIEPGLERAELAKRRKDILSKEYQKPNGKTIRFNERTLRQYLAAYREKGFEGLYLKGRSDAGQARVLTPEILDKACQLKAELPERSVRQILDMLKDEEIQGVKASTLSRHLVKQGLIRALAKPERIFRRFRKEHRNCLWQSDLKYGPYLPDPKNPKKARRTYLIAFLDDYSRLVPHGEFYWEENLSALEDCLKKAILRRGIPDNIYVDNGKVFVSKHFKLACAKMNIRHMATQPYSPEAKGKIERFFGYVESSFMPEARMVKFKTLTELNEHFWAWLEEAYNHKTHASLLGTPAQTFAEDKQRLRIAVPEEIDDAFLYETERYVDKTGCIKFNGRVIEAGSNVVSEKITVRYDPYNEKKLEIWHSGKKVKQTEQASEVLKEELKPDRASYLTRLLERENKARKQRFGAIAFREMGGDDRV